MKSLYIILALVIALPLTGCAKGAFNLQSLAGINISDLEAARADGRTKTFSMSYDDAYAKVLAVLKEQELEVFRANKNGKYIVAIGFSKQETTTRVGIFFDPVSDSETSITLSSLSSSCLAKAEGMIFSNL